MMKKIILIFIGLTTFAWSDIDKEFLVIKKEVLEHNSSMEINSSLENLEKAVIQKKAVDELIDTIERQKGYQYKNRQVPYKDVNFLYDITINGDYIFRNKLPLDKEKTRYVTHIETHFWSCLLPWKSCTDEYILDGDENNKIANPPLTIKLAAIEEQLNMTRDEKDTTLERIAKLYKKLGYENWDSDRVEFAVFTNYSPSLESTFVGAGLMVYPSYSKIKPGSFNPFTRYAIYIATGSYQSLDSETTLSGAPIVGGVNIALQYGFGINIGYEYYGLQRDDGSVDGKSGMVYGVTLSSELWRRLFYNGQ